MSLHTNLNQFKKEKFAKKINCRLQQSPFINMSSTEQTSKADLKKPSTKTEQTYSSSRQIRFRISFFEFSSSYAEKIRKNMACVLRLRTNRCSDSLPKSIHFPNTPAFLKCSKRQHLRNATLWIALLFHIFSKLQVIQIVDWLIHYFLDGPCEKYYITNEKYTEPQSRKKRCYTLVKWSYSIIYYLISSIWAYKIMVKSTFMPPWLGGNGSPFSLAEMTPFIPDATQEMKVFYIAQFGKHFSRFFGHVFIRAEGNFFEYALHHGLSIFLIMFSYLTNQWHIGIFVLLIHDYSDFGLIMARTYKDYRNFSKKILDIIYIHAFISWCGCRIVLFIGVCIYPAIWCIFHLPARFTEFDKQILIFPCAFMIFMMIGLQILHIFWTYYIAQSFVSVKVSSKMARHSYD